MIINATLASFYYYLQGRTVILFHQFLLHTFQTGFVHKTRPFCGQTFAESIFRERNMPFLFSLRAEIGYFSGFYVSSGKECVFYSRCHQESVWTGIIQWPGASYRGRRLLPAAGRCGVAFQGQNVAFPSAEGSISPQPGGQGHYFSGQSFTTALLKVSE